jgi:quinol monooxygenase YgiN
MAQFIQIVECEATDIDGIATELTRFQVEHPGVLTAMTSTITEDRDRPGTYLAIVEFPSYEKAMEQQDNPATQEFSANLSKIMSGAPRFRNLDVLAVLSNP